MKLSTFSGYFFGLIMLLFVSFMGLKEHFNGKKELQETLALTQEQLEQEKIKTAMMEFEMESMRQKVAIALPKKVLDQDYSVRKLASVTRIGDSPLEDFSSEKAFKMGKDAFREKNYNKSNKILTEMVSKYKYSVNLPEAYFLLIEGLYQTNDYERCLKNLEVMVDQFPDSELTGFAMLRMGQIYESKERSEEAKSIYSSVIKSFKNKELKNQAQSLLDKLNL